MAFDYCCSLGLRIAELTNWQDLQIANLGKIKYTHHNKLVWCLNSDDKTIPTASIIGESFIDGQQRDVWCNSKIPITDMDMHWGGSQYKEAGESFNKSASCYVVFFSGIANQNRHGLILNGDTCFITSSKLYSMIIFLCE